MTALMIAAYKGHLNIVQLLLQSNKVDVNQQDIEYDQVHILYTIQ